MAEINLLSQSTIDQIAAGEVVERPMSVVKELVENAIDAGANALTVELKEGGISLIRVTDNGSGIEKEQVKKAFLRHATSKIKTIEDLEAVESLGFRGEALSSIGAVSKVELITKTKDSLTGVRYTMEGGREGELEEIGAPCGTTFLIRSLFYNTPARRKFLKQPQTEGGYVADLMEHVALSRPDISIKFVNGGQIRFHTSGNGDLKEVIYRIYGREIAAAVLPFEAENEFCHITGFLGKPEINRSGRSCEIYFVNGRFVKDDIIAKALEEGYRQYVMQHKFPFTVLHIRIAPEEIDVNVHPAKMQIRIRRGKELYEFLSEAVKNRLRETQLIPDIKLSPDPEIKEKIVSLPEPFERKRIESVSLVREEAPSYGRDDSSERKETVFFSGQEEEKKQDFSQSAVTGKVIGESGRRNESLCGNIIKAADHTFVERPQQLDLFEEKILTREARADYRILGQIFDTYWLIAYQDKLMIADQHAAHEKVKYERLLKELSEKTLSSQLLSPPVIVTLTGREEELFKEFTDYFAQMGFEIEEFGGGSFAIRSVPADLYGCDEKQLFLALMDELAENPMKGAPDVVLQKLASMACKAAVKGNMKMNQAEMEALLDELLTLENPYHCPHGRPTIISMSKYEIEKKFKRIV